MSDDLLQIDVVDDHDARVLVVSGELDPSTAPDLASRLSGLEGTVVLDLRGIRFVDSSGLRTLIGASAELGERLVLRAPSPVVTRLFDLTGIAEHFTIEP